MTVLLWSVVLRELLMFNLLMDINDATFRVVGLHFASQTHLSYKKLYGLL